jgi:hypothetical protein
MAFNGNNLQHIHFLFKKLLFLSGSEAVEVFYHYFTFIAVGDLIITM